MIITEMKAANKLRGDPGTRGFLVQILVSGGRWERMRKKARVIVMSGFLHKARATEYCTGSISPTFFRVELTMTDNLALQWKRRG